MSWYGSRLAKRRLQRLADDDGDIVAAGGRLARHAHRLGGLVAQLLQGDHRLGLRVTGTAIGIEHRAADLAGAGATLGGQGMPGDAQSEAVIALQQLGYKPAEAARMAREATAAGDEAATIIRKALQSALR